MRWKIFVGVWRRIYSHWAGPAIKHVSAQWLRDHEWRSGTRGIDGPGWVWPLTSTQLTMPTTTRGATGTLATGSQSHSSRGVRD